jgi:hypothetical protein
MPTNPLTLPSLSKLSNHPAFSPKHGSMNFCPMDGDFSIGWNALWYWIVTDRTSEIAPGDPSRKIAEMPILSWRWVKAIWGMVLRAVDCGSCRFDLYYFWEMGKIGSRNSRPVWLPKLNSLPIGLNRISWKQNKKYDRVVVELPLPIGLNRISWKQNLALRRGSRHFHPLPIGLNRISWKRGGGGLFCLCT